MSDSAPKIGILSGMFDPIHLGHLNSANQATEQFGLDFVFFIPTAVAPHKREASAGAADRLAMTKSAIESNPAFRISEIEMGEDSPSYSYDTVSKIKEEYDSLFFIVGLDAFEEIHTWKSADRLMKSCNVVVASRPGFDIARVVSKFESAFREKEIDFELTETQDKYCELAISPVGSPYSIYICRFTEMNISSTAVREKAAEGASFKYLVSPEVEKYILESGLYGACKR